MKNDVTFRSWTINENKKYAIKKCDKSFFDDKSTGLPKEDVCNFWGIDYSIKKRFIRIKYNDKEYDAYTSIKNDPSNRAILKWYSDLGDLLNEYKGKNVVAHYKKINDHLYELNIYSNEDEDYILRDEYTEGEERLCEAIRYERKPENRRRAIIIHGFNCEACGFNFEKNYGDLGKNYIEVHHIVPLYIQKAKKIIDPETDLICLCSNCHRMIHRIRSVDYDKSLEYLKNTIN